MFGLNTASLALKAGSLFGSVWMRVVAIALALAALGFVVWRTIATVQNWQEQSYAEGRKAGVDSTNAAWQKVAAENFRMQRDQAIADAARNNKSVADYLSAVSASRAISARTKEEIVRYAKSPAGSTRCVNGDGMRILFEERAALGLTGGSRSTAPAPAPGGVH